MKKIIVRFEKNSSNDTQLLNEYKKVVDASSIVSIANKKGIITYVNSEFCRISGYSEDELVGKNHNIVRHPNMPASAFYDLWKTIKSKKVWKGIVENLKKNGDSYFVKATIVPVLDEAGDIVEYIGLREDITELIEKEKEIQRLNSENLKTVTQKAFSIKTTQMLESVPVPLISIDKDNNILQYNDEFYKLFDIGSANDFLTLLSNKKANIEDIFSFDRDEDDLLDWKDQMIVCGDSFEVTLKHESSEKKFSMRLKENEEENNYIAAFI